MPPVYYLNAPPHPFYEFVTGLQDHPFFRGPPPAARGRFSRSEPVPSETRDAAQTPQPTEPLVSEKVKGKQPSVENEDPPEMDPSTIEPQNRRGARHEARQERRAERHEARDRFKGRGRFAGAFDDETNNDNDNANAATENNEEGEHRFGYGRRCGMRRHGDFGSGERRFRGPPPFMFPFFAGSPFAPGPDGPPGPPPANHGPPHHHGPRHGPPHMRGRDGFGPRGPHESHGRGHPHGPPHGRPHSPPFEHRGPRGHRGSREPFDLSAFLSNLGERIGVDLNGAAASFGLPTQFTAPKSGQETDFEPRTDIFENKDQYTVHLSLPGAKKQDVAVDYDGEHSTLRITGIVHRPEVDEKMLSELAVDGRKRETGVFEKAIRLGTKKEPANIDVSGISAKMSDGILIVKVPKVEQVVHRREVPVTAEDFELDPSQHEDEQDVYSGQEKGVIFDADEQTLHEVPATSAPVEHTDGKKEIEKDLLEPETEKEAPVPVKSFKGKEKEAEAEHARAEAAKEVPEQLPAYHVEEPEFEHQTKAARDDAEENESDWEKFSDEGEGEYIKINVD